VHRVKLAISDLLLQMWMLNSYDFALFLAAKTRHAKGRTGQTSSLGWNDTSKVFRVLVLV